jgi:hypothetical protein
MEYFGWQFFLFVFGMRALVLLVMGPGNWSSGVDFPLVTAWHWVRRKLFRR